jgi:hypothetical protein
MSIVLMDTSVFCNVLDVPGFNQDRDTVIADLKNSIRNRDTLLLPMAAVIETGNHISQVIDGRLRRQSAERFCEKVAAAIDGTAPWTAMRFWEPEQLRNWLGTFPDRAMQKVGMADLSIIKDWESMCELHRGQRVRIWSLDDDLIGYDRKPTL